MHSTLARHKVLKTSFERRQETLLRSAANIGGGKALERLNIEIAEVSDQIINLDERIKKAQTLITMSRLPLPTSQ